MSDIERAIARVRVHVEAARLMGAQTMDIRPPNTGPMLDDLETLLGAVNQLERELAQAYKRAAKECVLVGKEHPAHIEAPIRDVCEWCAAAIRALRVHGMAKEEIRP